MSKYKYEMYVGTRYHGSTVSAEIDLVEDWGYDESDLDQRTEEDILKEIEDQALDDFIWGEIDCGVKRING